MAEKKEITYTLILHQIRKELKLTLMEYCVADSIYHLSNNPKSQVKGWCYASKETMSKMLGSTRKTIFETIKKLIEKGFVEKDEETKHIRTTSNWYEGVVLVKAKIEYNEITQGITKGDRGITKGDSRLSRKVTPDYNETTPNIYTNNDNNKETNKESADKSAGKDVNDLIDLFKSINPSYRKFFGNKTQRSALERMLERIDKETLVRAIQSLPKTNLEKYAPKITTPLQLEDKMGSLIAYIQSKKTTNPIFI